MAFRSLRFRHDALIFAVLGLLLVNYAAAAAGVYLAPAGSPEWDGNCQASALEERCNMSSPCGVPSSALALTAGNSTSCLIYFSPGNYSGYHMVVEDSENVEMDFGQRGLEGEKHGTVQLTGPVTDLSLFIRSAKLTLYGVVADSKLNISLEKSFSTLFEDFNATQSTFVFSATTPLTVRSKVITQFCRFSLLGNAADGIASLFTFNVGASSGPSSVRLQDTSIFLSASSGLIHSAGSVGPSMIALNRADTHDAHHIYSFDELSPTALSIVKSKVNVISNVFLSVNGVDPISFNAQAKPLDLTVSEATITGPKNALAQAYDPHGCVNVNMMDSVVSNLDINCNAPSSGNLKDRCTYDMSGMTLRDNHLCVYGSAGSMSTPRWYQVAIVVSMPPIAPIMTVFGNFTTTSSTWTILTTSKHQDATSAVDGSTSKHQLVAASPSIPFLISGDTWISDSVLAKYLTLETGASATFDQIVLDSNSQVLMRDGSSLLCSYIGGPTIRSPASFIMDGAGNATVDVRASQSHFTVYPYAATIATDRAPLINLGTGVKMLLPVDYNFFTLFLRISWNSTLLGEPQDGRAYVLVNNAVFHGEKEPGHRYRFTSAGGYTFDAWSEPNHNCAECRTILFGLPGAGIPIFSPPKSPSSPSSPSSPPSLSPSNPSISPGGCRGYAPESQGWVCRSDGNWGHPGDWRVLTNASLLASDSSSFFYVHGSLSFAPGCSVTMIGTGSLNLDRCATITSPQQLRLDYSSSGYPTRFSNIHIVLIQDTSCQGAVGAQIPYTILPPPPNPKVCDVVTIKPVNYLYTGLELDFTVESRECRGERNLPLILGIVFGVLGGIAVTAGVVSIIIYAKRRRDVKSQQQGGFASDYEPLINN